MTETRQTECAVLAAASRCVYGTRGASDQAAIDALWGATASQPVRNMEQWLERTLFRPRLQRGTRERGAR